MKALVIAGFTIVGAVVGGGLETNQRRELCNQGLTMIPGLNQACKTWVKPGAAIDGGLLGGIVGFGVGAVASSLLSDDEFDPRLITWLSVAAIASGQLLVTQPQSVSAVKPSVNPSVNTDVKIKAFLDVIAHAEGTGDRYNIMMGFDTFTNFSDHPRQCKPFFNPQTQRNDCSDAAGRYQFISHPTWDEIKRRENLPDFSPASQDRAAITLLTDLGIPKLLEQGDFIGALRAGKDTWVSLYPNASKQRVAPLEELKAVYEKSLKEYQK